MLLSVAVIERSMRMSRVSARPGVPPPPGGAARAAKGDAGEAGEAGSPPVGCRVEEQGVGRTAVLRQQKQLYQHPQLQLLPSPAAAPKPGPMHAPATQAHHRGRRGGGAGQLAVERVQPLLLLRLLRRGGAALLLQGSLQLLHALQRGKTTQAGEGGRIRIWFGKGQWEARAPHGVH